jgi:predicted CopG family antitoxin
MATKTISIDLEAYEALKRAKLSPKDSFSRVIKRARWEQTGETCGDLLAAVASMPVADDAVLDLLERAQKEDRAPDIQRSATSSTSRGRF